MERERGGGGGSEVVSVQDGGDERKVGSLGYEGGANGAQWPTFAHSPGEYLSFANLSFPNCPTSTSRALPALRYHAIPPITVAPLSPILCRTGVRSIDHIPSFPPCSTPFRTGLVVPGPIRFILDTGYSLYAPLRSLHFPTDQE